MSKTNIETLQNPKRVNNCFNFKISQNKNKKNETQKSCNTGWLACKKNITAIWLVTAATACVWLSMPVRVSLVAMVLWYQSWKYSSNRSLPELLIHYLFNNIIKKQELNETLNGNCFVYPALCHFRPVLFHLGRRHIYLSHRSQPSIKRLSICQFRK